MSLIFYYIYIMFVQIIVYLLKKQQKYMVIQSNNNYVNTTKLQKGHKFMLERYASKQQIYKTNPFSDIIELNTDNKTTYVGGNITIGRFINYLYPMGLSIKGVPELKGLVVEELIKKGFFQDSIIDMTLVKKNGEIKKSKKVSNDESIADVQFKLVSIKKCMALDFIVVKEKNKVVDVLQEKVKENVDFLEAIVYDDNQTIVIIGTMVDELVYPIIDPFAWFDKYYYEQVKDFVSKGIYRCTMNIDDYYFRHDRGYFWLHNKVVGNETWKRCMNPFICDGSDMPKQLKDYEQIITMEYHFNYNRAQDALRKLDSIYPIWIKAEKKTLTLGIYGYHINNWKTIKDSITKL